MISTEIDEKQLSEENSNISRNSSKSSPGRYKRDTETTMEDIASIESIRMNVKKTSRRFMHEKGQQNFFTRESERPPLNYSRQS